MQLKGGAGQPGDSYEQHADAVASKVVRGAYAELLLGASPSPTPWRGDVQRKEAGGEEQAGAKKTPVEFQQIKNQLLQWNAKVMEIYTKQHAVWEEVSCCWLLGEAILAAGGRRGDLAASPAAERPPLPLTEKGREVLSIGGM